MRRTLQLAALAFTLTTTCRAQFHFPQHHAKPVQKEDLSWLATFANPAPDGREAELLHDSRFKPFLRDHLTAPQTFWNQNQSLADTVIDFLGVPSQVVLDQNRFLSITGCVPDFCPSRGLLFIDLGLDNPFIAFAAIDWTKENKVPGQPGADYTLWLFTNRTIDQTEVPAALKATLARWTALPSSGSNTRQNITASILVDPDGTPHQVAPATLGIQPVPEAKAKS